MAIDRVMKAEEGDSAYFTGSRIVYNILLLIAAIVLWAMNVSWNPRLDDVSVYHKLANVPPEATPSP